MKIPGPLETRLSVAKCVSTLMKKKDLSRISVTEVCRQCDISRTTFYEYFQDIFAVPEWVWDYACREILEKIGTDYGWGEGHRRMFECMLENQTLFQHTENENSSFMSQANDRSLSIHIRSMEEKLGRPLTDTEKRQMSYYSYLQASMTHKWIHDGMTDSPAEMQALIESVTPPLVAGTLGK